MIKEARRTSMDPAQERLRQTKAVWNKDVSSFINDVIHLKKLMNGWPSKFHKERSKIGDPIPADPAAILGTLAGDFQELAQRGSGIAQQQVQYAQTRTKKRKDQAVRTLDKLQQQHGPETAPPPPAAPSAPTAPTGADLSKQLAAWEQKYELVVEGSNPLSRFWARMKTPRFGFGHAAQLRRLRRDMLDAALKTYKALSKVQVYATKSSKQSVVEAHKYMKVAWDSWSQVSRSYNLLVNSMPGQSFRQEEMRDELPPGVEPNLTPSPVKPPPVQPVPIQPIPTSPKEKKNKQPDSGPPMKLVDTIPPANASSELEAVAQAFVQKWIGKNRHQLLPGKSSGVRLQVYELCHTIRRDINASMDLLEKGLDFEQLGTKISQVSGSINTLRSLMRSLFNMERPPTKNAPPMEGFF